MKKYYIKIHQSATRLITFIIPNIILKGKKQKLESKLRNHNFVNTLDIDEYLWFEPFTLIEKNKINFPTKQALLNHNLLHHPDKLV